MMKNVGQKKNTWGGIKNTFGHRRHCRAQASAARD